MKSLVVFLNDLFRNVMLSGEFLLFPNQGRTDFSYIIFLLVILLDTAAFSSLDRHFATSLASSVTLNLWWFVKLHLNIYECLYSNTLLHYECGQISAAAILV